MLRRALWTIAATALLLLQSIPTSHAQQPFDAGAASLKLTNGMTMAQVEQAVGYRPSASDETTCGTRVGPGWPCMVWYFNGGMANTLQVLFRRTPVGAWVVNGWNTY